MTLRTWIVKTGPKAVAQKLKVDPSTVAYWRQGKSLPHPKTMMAIVKATRGRVSYEEMITGFVGRNR